MLIRLRIGTILPVVMDELVPLFAGTTAANQNISVDICRLLINVSLGTQERDGSGHLIRHLIRRYLIRHSCLMR